MSIEYLSERKSNVSRVESLDAAKIHPQLGLAKNEQEILYEARTGFVSKDMGESRMLFESFYSWMRKHSDSVMAPRTGHIGGTWEAIMLGGGGPVAFNRGVLELGLGYPLLFDTNMTPDIKTGRGDNLYYPGTVLGNNGQLVELEQFTLQNGKFLPPTRPDIYSPFVATKINGVPTAINYIHRSRLKNLTGRTYVSDVLWRNWGQVETYLRIIFKRALLGETPYESTVHVQKAVDRWVGADGVVSDARFFITERGLERNNKCYDWDEFVDLIKLNVYISSHPETMPDLIEKVKDGIPLMSKEFLILCLALLDTDFVSGAKSQGKINPHFHWGGFQMAGLGKDRGYFQNSVATIRALMQDIRIGSNEPPLPIAYTLMPAGIFLLLPHLSAITETDAINNLLNEVTKEPEGKVSKTKTMEYIKKIVNEWLAKGSDKKLSKEFISRFSKYNHPMKNIPTETKLFIPEPFYGLSIQQLIITAGYLKEALNEH